MCLLAIFFRAVPDAALVAGANREEFYDRPGEPPQILDGPVRAVGGRDPRAGGTWFGVNAAGVVAAVTNRPLPAPTKKSRSRGLLVRDLLGCPFDWDSSIDPLLATASRVTSHHEDLHAAVHVLVADSRADSTTHHHARRSADDTDPCADSCARVGTKSAT